MLLRWVATLERQVSRTARSLSGWFGWLYLVAAIVITGNVIARRFLGFSLFGITEIGGYLLALGIAFGLAHTLATRGHIRVDVLIRQIPWLGVRSVLHTLALAALTLFGAVMTVRAWSVLERSLRLGTRDLSALQIPLAIPQSFWVFGLAFFSLLAGVMLLRSLLLLLRGDFAGVDTMYAVLSEEDQVAEVVGEVQDYRDELVGEQTRMVEK
jgi:TRAP-type C4-dicarboxylate transport system permease small subunit